MLKFQIIHISYKNFKFYFEFFYVSKSKINLPDAICCCHAGHVSFASLLLLFTASITSLLIITITDYVKRESFYFSFYVTITAISLITSSIALVFGHIKQFSNAFIPWIIYIFAYSIFRITLLVLVATDSIQFSNHFTVADCSADKPECQQLKVLKFAATLIFYIETLVEFVTLAFVLWSSIVYRRWVAENNKQF